MYEKKYSLELIVAKLKEVKIILSQGGTVTEACLKIGVTEQNYYRWRREYCGLISDNKKTSIGGEHITWQRKVIKQIKRMICPEGKVLRGA